jgi:hypothetical protein
MRIENPLAEEKTIAQWVALVNNVSGTDGDLSICRRRGKSLFNNQFDGRDGLRFVERRKIRRITLYFIKTQNRENFA